MNVTIFLRLGKWFELDRTRDSQVRSQNAHLETLWKLEALNSDHRTAGEIFLYSRTPGIRSTTYIESTLYYSDTYKRARIAFLDHIHILRRSSLT